MDCTRHIESSIRLYAVYEDADSVHLVLENCMGTTLAELVRVEEQADDSIELDEEPMVSDPPAYLENERAIKRVMRQLLYSVRRMHELGIAHRDLKLENVMLTKKKIGGQNESLRIIDFGLSGHFDAENARPQLKGVVGTPHYMAPEIAHEQSYDAKVDTWAMGVIAYKLFSKGQFPFEGDDEDQILEVAK